MRKELTIRAMPAIYIKMNLVQIDGTNLDYDLQKREVYLPETLDLKKVLELLSKLILEHRPRHLFCLNWGEDSYYFESDGSYSKFEEAPRSILS